MDRLILENQCQLAWTEYGAPEGEPVFYFHGMQGSRLEPSPADAIAHDMGIRLIAPDRPGYGNSDPHEDFKLLDWPDVISQLADHLNLNQFSIIAYSAGGAYALACGNRIPARIKHVTLLSATAPFDTEVMQTHLNAILIHLFELATVDKQATVQQVSQLAASPEALLDSLLAMLPPCDKVIFDQAHIQEHYLKNITLALNKGINGIVNDLRCLGLPWQFNLQDIPVDVDIWHGREDNNIGFPVAEYLARALPDPTTHFFDNKGHCYLFEQWNDILEHYKS
ncbi:MAG: alpha/beta hydrolase [Gammaproteobacteria bacterium]|nr:alpha/beta hydrolase [Gammaproteobacteria bacterium]